MITGFDQILTAVANAQSYRSDFSKQSPAGACTAGRWYSLLTTVGAPPAMTFSGTALNSQQVTDASHGGIMHGGSVSTLVKHLVNMMACTGVATGVPAQLLLVDVLMYYPGISMASAVAQSLVNPVSLPRYTDGKGVRAFLEITTASGATAHNVYISYTNDAATAGKTLPGTVACTASAIANHITHSGTAANNVGPFLPLAMGDAGIRSVQSLTLSASSAAGAASLVLCKPLASIPLLTTSVAVERNLVMDLPSAPIVQDGACLGLLLYAGAAVAANSAFFGSLETVWG